MKTISTIRLFRHTLCTSVVAAIACISNGCGTNHTTTPERSATEELTDSLHAIVNRAPGTVGVALVSDSDTITINNGVRYPMMSVFKLHQAIAVTDFLSRTHTDLDSTILVGISALDRDTWSPMLKQYSDRNFTISIGQLLRYAVAESDNNASNILFRRIVNPEETDSVVRTIAPDTTFSIRYSEAAMKERHDLSYANYTSPLSAALLIRKVFTDTVVDPSMQESLKGWLSSTVTGTDRLAAPVTDNAEVMFAHKTGSGYRNTQGELIAHNDVGYFRLPDGKSYALAVLIRDFNGTEAEASAVIAEISDLVYRTHYSPLGLSDSSDIKEHSGE